MPIIYRAAKGAPLTADEVDGNFKDLDDRLKTLEETPPDAEGIASVFLENDHMTLKGTHGNTFGPFPLPKIFWKPRGPWQKETLYAPFDVVAHGKSLFSCLTGHTSGESFTAAPAWQEVFSFPEPLPTTETVVTSAVAAPPCEKDNLPAHPRIGQLAYVVDLSDRAEICYFTGTAWCRLSNHEGI